MLLFSLSESECSQRQICACFSRAGSFLSHILSLFISSGPRKSLCYKTIPFKSLLMNFIFSQCICISFCFSVSRLRDWFSPAQYFISMWLNNPCLLLCLELITHQTASEAALIPNDYSRSGLLEKRACADISAKLLLPSCFLHISEHVGGTKSIFSFIQNRWVWI